MTELKTQRMIAEAASEKEAIEMKNMKPVETNPNDTVALNQDSIIPTEEATLEVERVDNAPLQEEKVEMPSQEIASEGVAVPVDLEVS